MFEEDVIKERKWSIDLEDIINVYIDWCTRNYDDEYVKGVKKFIDDMVEWFEEWCDRNMPFELGFAEMAKSDQLFIPSVLEIVSFISSYETNYLKYPVYDTEQTFKLVRDDSHMFSLTPDGRVMDCGKTQFELPDKDGFLHEFNNVTVDDLLEWLEDEDIFVYIEDFNTLNDIIDKYVRDVNFVYGLLDTVMYKLIERGGSYYGTIRGYLFAECFDIDKSIALTYGLLDMSGNNDEDKKMLIEVYLTEGGDADIECYGGYFSNDKNNIYTKELVDVIRDLDMNLQEGSKLYDIINQLIQETEGQITRIRIDRNINE